MLLSLYLISCALAFIMTTIFSHRIAVRDNDLSLSEASFLNFIFSVILCFFWYFVMVYFFYTITLKHEKQPRRRSEA